MNLTNVIALLRHTIACCISAILCRMQEIGRLGQSIGACNERIGSKARQLLSIVDSTTADPESSSLQLDQAKAALTIHFRSCQVMSSSSFASL